MSEKDQIEILYRDIRIQELKEELDTADRIRDILLTLLETYQNKIFDLQEQKTPSESNK